MDNDNILFKLIDDYDEKLRRILWKRKKRLWKEENLLG